MSEHTPGPWRVYPPRPFRTGLEVHVARAEGVRGPLVATVTDENGPNAHLIAAAPDMLAELKRLRDVVGDEDASCIDAVIAQAEGKP